MVMDYGTYSVECPKMMMMMNSSFYQSAVVLLLLALAISPAASSMKEPMSNFDVIEHFSAKYDIDGLHRVMSGYFKQTERNTDASQVKRSKLSTSIIQKGAGLTYTSRYKLKHDLEQAEYLSEHLFSSNKTEAEFFKSVVVPVYKRVLDTLPSDEKFEAARGFYFFQQKDYNTGIGDLYNKALHVTDFSENITDVNGNPVSLLNANLDLSRIERQWHGEETDDSGLYHPGIVYIDNLLSPLALERVRQIMLESTAWYETKTTNEGGYVGAYIDDGLYDRLLIAVAYELHKALPRIMEKHPLRYLWAYKYDERYSGIGIHADEAAVNVNIWLTPNSANLDKDSGGLVVYTVKPPASWDQRKYNKLGEHLEELLRPSNFSNITVPYKQNRAVLFDSALFHKTDDFRFKPGYENRRINLTILYGKMQKATTTDGESGKEEL